MEGVKRPRRRGAVRQTGCRVFERRGRHGGECDELLPPRMPTELVSCQYPVEILVNVHDFDNEVAGATAEDGSESVDDEADYPDSDDEVGDYSDEDDDDDEAFGYDDDDEAATAADFRAGEVGFSSSDRGNHGLDEGAGSCGEWDGKCNEASDSWQHSHALLARASDSGQHSHSCGELIGWACSAGIKAG